MIKIEDYSKKLEGLKHDVKKVFDSIGYPYKEPQNNEKIHMVFAGQYSAGKSSILRMLTGRNDIKIGEGITTQKVTKYDWNGIEVIDTPGIHTELRPDHDALSYEAIASADLLVYVVTNELFDSNLGKRFRTVAIDKDKAGEMVLVINKMEREGKGNTQESQNVKKEALVNVTKPYSPDDLRISFLSAESYLDSLDEADSEIAESYKKRSGYDKFVKTLNDFIYEKNIPSKLTTVLYQIDSEIAAAIAGIESEKNDTDIRALEEENRQQRSLLVEGRDSLRQEVLSVFINSSAEIKNIGLDAANSICNGCNEREIELELSEKTRQAQCIMEEAQNQAVSLIENKLNELKLAIDNLENSDFSKELKIRLKGRMKELPDNVKKVLDSGNSLLKNASSKIIKNSYNANAAGGLKFSNFSGSNVHDIVLKAGKTIGYKFKPWQALKITKGVAVAAHVLTIFGVVFTVGMQIAEDVQTEEVRKNLEQNRVNVRCQFNDAANGLEKFGRDFVRKIIDNNINPSITEIDGKIRGLQENSSLKNENYRKLIHLQDECVSLIKEIHK